MSRGRLEAFSDGIFAIVITLLFLEIKLPSNAEPSIAWLIELSPLLGVCILSFWIVGTYWVAHHTILSFAPHVDRRLLYLNLLLLLCIVMTPFATKMLAEHPGNLVALGFYGTVLSGINLIGTAIWLRATAHANTLSTQRVRQIISLIHAAPVAVYILGFGLGFFNPWFSLALYAFVPAFFSLPNPWLERVTQQASNTLGMVSQETE